MKTLLLLISLLYFSSIASQEVSVLLEADQLFQATLFDAAKDRYRVALTTHLNDRALALKIRARLTEILFIQKNYNEAVQIAKEADFLENLEEKDIRLKGIYFQALSFKSLHQESQALNLLEQYLKIADVSATHHDEVLLELGEIYESSQNVSAAENCYKSIIFNIQKPATYYLAQLNLSRIHLMRDEPKQALEILKKLNLKRDIDQDLFDKVELLTGLTLLRLNACREAISRLSSLSLIPEARYYLGLAYLKERSFVNAEKNFQSLIEESNYEEEALIGLAKCYLEQSQLEKASALLSRSIQTSNLNSEAEILLLRALAAPNFLEKERLFKKFDELKFQQTAVYTISWYERAKNAFNEALIHKEIDALAHDCLQEAFQLLKMSDHPAASTTLYMTGQLFFLRKNLKDAEEAFVKIIEEYPSSPYIPETLLLVSKCIEDEVSRAYRKRVFEDFPHSKAAAEAYFTYYPYRDYVQGERTAIKHLQAMPSRFPDSPYLVVAFYLIGMDNKRDRKTAQGKWIRKKNLMEAIQALQEAETTFERLDTAGKIPEEDKEFYTQVRYRAIMERALANYNIAEESQGAKQLIFLEYAAEVFNQIRQDFKKQHTFSFSLFEESSYWLVQTYLKSKNEQTAETILLEISEMYPLQGPPKGYFLSRVFYELGMIAMRRKEFQKALVRFDQAEKAAEIDLLNSDQKIDLWIQQSLCYQDLKNYDQAMLILSQAINDNSFSSLRVKAMYLRAEIYALQGRHDLSKKQLEATAKKGGEWALKAQETLKQKENL